LESLDTPLDVKPEFISQNQEINYKIPKKGGPYSKTEREKRRDEVYRLYFEYGYSESKIAGLMKVNRNTIRGDVDHWNSKILKNANIANPEYVILLILERLEIQYSRLREQLDRAKTFQEKVALEKMMYDIDCRTINIFAKLGESQKRIWDITTDKINELCEKKNINERNLKWGDLISLPNDAIDKISKIIKDENLKRSKLRHN
jgi:hypothetical protein